MNIPHTSRKTLISEIVDPSVLSSGPAYSIPIFINNSQKIASAFHF